MIPALLRGKLSREQENLEDILTSIVFGCLQYLPYESGLYLFLALAGGEPAEDWLPQPSNGLVVQYEFWPWLTSQDGIGCEPDLLISFNDLAGRTHMRLLIEVKLWSEKSSRPDPDSPIVTDQLAREWCCLVEKCTEDGAQAMMLYLTAKAGGVTADIEEAAMELVEKHPALALANPMRCVRLSWAHIPRALEGASGMIERDLCAIIQRIGLGFFDGVSAIRPIANADWVFSRQFALTGLPQPRIKTWSFTR